MRCIRRYLATLLVAVAIGPGIARAEPALRIAVLKFGTVSWVMDVIAHHGLAKANGIRIDELALASTPATLVALQAGRVDCAVSDWLWVSRQRAAGADWTFFPFSTDLGALVAARGAPIHRLADLRHRRLGVAGSPLDKSWVILQALAKEQHIDLAREARVSFGAPPLLNQELLQGRLDAVLTFWNFAARLTSRGLPVVLPMSDALRQLGFKTPIPLVGYVVSDRWRGRIRARWPGSCAPRVRPNPSWPRRMPNGPGSDEGPGRATLPSLRRCARASAPAFRRTGAVASGVRRGPCMRSSPKSAAERWSARAPPCSPARSCARCATE